MRKIILILISLVLFNMSFSTPVDVIYMGGYTSSDSDLSQFFYSSNVRKGYYGGIEDGDTVKKSIEEQAEKTKETILGKYGNNLEEYKKAPKVIFGYSQGGLRAWAYAKNYQNTGANIKGIITVGTPWRGAPIVAKNDEIKNLASRTRDGLESLVAVFVPLVPGINIGDFRINIPNIGIDWLKIGASYAYASMLGTGGKDMAPSGGFMQKVLNNKNMKIVHWKHERYWQWHGMFDSGWRTRTVVSWIEYKKVWSGEASLPKGIIVGAIRGGDNNIFHGSLEGTKGSFETASKVMKYTKYAHYVSAGIYGVASWWNPWLLTQVANHVAWAKKAESLENLLSPSGVQNKTNELIGSPENDTTIPQYSQKINTQVVRGEDLIVPGDAVLSNHLVPDAIHVGRGPYAYKTEPYDIDVQDQAQEWLEIIAGKIK